MNKTKPDKSKRPKHPIPDPVTIKIKERTYQPSQAEFEESQDMPGLSLNKSRIAFARPFKFKKDCLPAVVGKEISSILINH